MIGRSPGVSSQLDDLAVDQRGAVEVLWSEDRRASGGAIPLFATSVPGTADAILDPAADRPQASLTADAAGFAAAWTRRNEAFVAFD